jgi:hypothetical protein
MRPLHAAPLAALALLLAACGHDQQVPLGPGIDPAGSLRLTVHTSIEPGRHGEMFTEGAVPEIRLEAPDGTVLEPAKDHADAAVFAGLDAGRYRLRAALRPCDGNCGSLDAPTLPCTAEIRIDADRVVTVRWHVGEPCHVRS